MNLPNIPTDNLYKFMAIFGLILSVFGISIYIYYVNEQAEEAIKLETQLEEYISKQKWQIKEMQAGLQLFKEEIGIDIDSIDYYNGDTNNFIGILDSRLYLNFHINHKVKDEKLLEILEFYRDYLLPDFEQSRLLEIKINKTNSIFELKQYNYRIFNRISWIIVGLGIILMIIGFNAWYFIYQKPLDKLSKAPHESYK